MKTKQFEFKLTTVAEDGTFEGMLSTYGNVDLGGDVCEPGCFTKTLKESKGEVPMLWSHDPEQPIGSLELVDSAEGLKCKGTLALEVQKAKDVHALMKRKIVKGLSIGYKTVKDSIEGGVRHLKELALFEGSAVVFPMNMQALISAVKAAGERKDDFNTELLEIQLYAARYQMLDAIGESLMEIRCDSDLTAEQKVTASHESIQQFETAYCEMLPQYLSMIAVDDDSWMMTMSARLKVETKAGRTLSAVNQSAIEQCIADLQALLDAAKPADSGAAKTEPAAIDHSDLVSFKDSLISAFVQ